MTRALLVIGMAFFLMVLYIYLGWAAIFGALLGGVIATWFEYNRRRTGVK